ncbi:MAG TPA: glycosyltransferase family 4 protein [Sedimentisphaerales bacterium]|nr:glycosyltransferase family 4 protein [Sedimentisphaerales bacterium]
MPKVAIIIERADITLGGAERSVFELASALRQLDFEVDVLAAKGHTNAPSIRFLCQDLPGKRTSYRLFAKKLKAYLARNYYDIVHSVLPFDFVDIYQPRGGCFVEAILRNAASYPGKFIRSYKLLTAFANFRRTWFLLGERKLCKKPDGPVIAALSQYVADQFERHYGLDKRRIKIIPNGIKTGTEIDKAKADVLRRQILAQLPQSCRRNEPTFFLFAANNFRLKGLAVLLKAMSLAAPVPGQPQPCLIIAGRGRSGKYRRLAKKLNVHNRLVFLGKLRNIHNVLAMANVAVLPTFYDPCSRFVLEAIAAGKPVITTRFNGAVDSFVNHLHGEVIDSPNNVRALADAITRFTDPRHVQQAATAIERDNLRENVSISRSARQFEQLYESIMKNRKC